MSFIFLYYIMYTNNIIIIYIIFENFYLIRKMNLEIQRTLSKKRNDNKK